MSRIRYLKPDFFMDEDLAALPLVERMTYAGLWCHADREGRLEYRPRFLKAEIWPYDDADMEDILKHLAAPDVPGRPNKSFVIIYEVGGKKFIQIIEFLKHQRPHHTERPSTIPPPNGGLTVKAPLLNRKHQEGMGMEKGKGKGKDEPEGSSPDALRLSGLLADEILKNNPAHRDLSNGKRDVVVRRWASDIDKLVRVDKKQPKEIEQVIRFAQSDPFWPPNIQSGKKLREKYETLKMQMQNRGAGKGADQAPLSAAGQELKYL